MDWNDIKPYLSERGALEVELAALRAQVALQAGVIGALQGDDPTSP